MTGAAEPTGPLSARVLTDAVVSPTIRIDSRPGRLLMGVFDADGAYVEGTVLDRRSGEQGEPVPAGVFGPPADREVEEAVYAGPLYFHFGHFLLESLARAWYTAQHPGLPLVWSASHAWQKKRLTSWQRDILAILGIETPPLLAAVPTRVRTLHVPDLGYRYDDVFHPEHARFLAAYDGPAQVPGERLWLSRSRIESDVRDLNGGRVEARLRRAGWTVEHPERTSVRDQLDHLARAEVVAGEEGSAFHALVLLRDVAGKRLEVLRRHGPEHRNMHTVGDARGVRQTFHTLTDEVVLSAEGRVVSKLSASAAEVLDVLEVPVVPAGAEPADWADPVLTTVLTQLAPARLLDVDASSSVPVAAARAGVRVVVSRRLRQDPRTLTASGIAVYELSLEEYAEHFHSGAEPFDVVRVAGRDVADVVGSFAASRALAHERTVWVLGCGTTAARAALAVTALHPGHVAQRLLVGRKVVFVVRRVPGTPTGLDGFADLSDAQVRTRTRWLRPTSLRRLHERLHGRTSG